MRTDLKIEAALMKVAAYSMADAQQGHDKQALIAAAGQALKFIPALFRGGAALVKGAPKVMNAAGQMAPAMGRASAARLAFQEGMKPGMIRQAVGGMMNTPGSTGFMSRMGTRLLTSGAKAHNAALAPRAAANAAWNSASGWGKAKIIGGKAFRAAPWIYTAGSLMNSHNQGQALNEAYASGAGEALGYMRANPMKTLGFMLTNPEYAANFIQNQPAFSSTGGKWVGGGMGDSAAQAFQGAYQTYNANPALIGDRIRQRVESNYEKPFSFGLPFIGS